jgi:hypothetical protein
MGAMPLGQRLISEWFPRDNPGTCNTGTRVNALSPDQNLEKVPLSQSDAIDGPVPLLLESCPPQPYFTPDLPAIYR